MKVIKFVKTLVKHMSNASSFENQAYVINSKTLKK